MAGPAGRDEFGQVTSGRAVTLFITGGARSGKSRFAMERALGISDQPVYIATAGEQDAEFGKRVERHKRERGDEWTVYEQYRNLSGLPLAGETVVVDCVTLWLSNLFTDYDGDMDATLDDFKEEAEKLLQLDARLILISNEIGMGVHAPTEVGRRFTDLQGWANQYIAKRADEVICMISGLPLYLKNGAGRSPA